jgi:hypothetical protein
VAIEEMEKGTSDCGCELGGCESKDNVVALHQKAQERIRFNLSAEPDQPVIRCQPVCQLDDDEAGDCDITQKPPGVHWPPPKSNANIFATAMPEWQNQLFLTSRSTAFELIHWQVSVSFGHARKEEALASECCECVILALLGEVWQR